MSSFSRSSENGAISGAFAFIFSLQESFSLAKVSVLGDSLIQGGHFRALFIDLHVFKVLGQLVFTFVVEVLNKGENSLVDGRDIVPLVIIFFFIAKELLLGSQDTAWSAESNVADEVRSQEFVVLQGISSNEGTSSSQTSLTVDSQSSLFSFSNLEEGVNDFIRRARAIQEIEIGMVDTILDESLFIVLFIVKSDDSGNSELFEDGDIIFRSESSVTFSISGLVRGATESNELAWNDPVQVTVFDLFVELVVSKVEILDVKEFKLDAVLQTSEAVQDAASVWGVGVRGISVFSKRRLGLGEGFPGFFSSSAENDDLESTH